MDDLYCESRAQGNGYGVEVNELFSKALHRPCFLVRKGNDGTLGCKRSRIQKVIELKKDV
jgi:hypothetical protein